MKVSKKLYLVIMLSAALVSFFILFSFTTAADSVCGQGWTWSGGPSCCPKCCRDLGNGYTQCTQPTCRFDAPKQLAPENGTIFYMNMPVTTLKWNPVRCADSYSLEVEQGDANFESWTPYISISSLKSTDYRFNSFNVQSVRWRVGAVTAEGYKSPKSPWWYYRYKFNIP